MKVNQWRYVAYNDPLVFQTTYLRPWYMFLELIVLIKLTVVSALAWSPKQTFPAPVLGKSHLKWSYVHVLTCQLPMTSTHSSVLLLAPHDWLDKSQCSNLLFGVLNFENQFISKKSTNTLNKMPIRTGMRNLDLKWNVWWLFCAFYQASSDLISQISLLQGSNGDLSFE